MTTDLFPEQKQQKVYKNGLTLSQNVQAGNFIPPVALKFQKKMETEMKELKDIVLKAIEKLSSK